MDVSVSQGPGEFSRTEGGLPVKTCLNPPLVKEGRHQGKYLDQPSSNLALSQHQKYNKKISGLKWTDENLFGRWLRVVAHLTPGVLLNLASCISAGTVSPSSASNSFLHPLMDDLTNRNNDSLNSCFPRKNFSTWKEAKHFFKKIRGRSSASQLRGPFGMHT